MPVTDKERFQSDEKSNDTFSEEKSPEEIFIPEEPKYSLDDIILSDAIKAQILDESRQKNFTRQLRGY